MRILYIAAGTGSFYCGSCMRDNAIVQQLRQAGHDVHLMPIYMPFSLDGDDATDCPLFLGGINAYLQQKMGLFRVTPRFIDALFDSKTLLRKAAQMTDMTTAAEHGDMTVSTLQGLQGKQRKEIKRMIRWVQSNLEVDAVVLSNLLLAGLGLELRKALKVPVVSSMQGEDGYLDALAEAESQEAWRLMKDAARQLDALIGVSRFYAAEMERRLELAAGTVQIVENGIELGDYRLADTRPEPPVMGFFAHICPSKGTHSVVDAFIELKKDAAFADWRLFIGGSCTQADEKYLKQQQNKLAAAGLTDAVEYHTNLSLEDKAAFYRKISVLSVAPNYQEAFGLYAVESIASGTPVILPSRGALSDIIALTGAGVAVACDEDGSSDGAVLAQAYREHVATAEGLAAWQAKAVTGRERVAEHYSLARMAASVYEIVDRAAAGFSTAS